MELGSITHSIASPGLAPRGGVNQELLALLPVGRFCRCHSEIDSAEMGSSEMGNSRDGLSTKLPYASHKAPIRL